MRIPNQLRELCQNIPTSSYNPDFGFDTFHTNSPQKRERAQVHLTEERKLSLLTFFKTLLYSRNLLVLTYIRFASSFTFAFFTTLFAIHAENSLLLIPTLIFFLLGIRGITSTLSRIPSGRLADKTGYKRPTILAFTLLTLVHLTFSETRNVNILTFAMIIYGAAQGLGAVIEWTMLAEYAPSETRNIATAYLSTIFNIGSALGAVTAGALAIFFNIQTIFKIASIITLTGAFSIALTQTSDKGK